MNIKKIKINDKINSLKDYQKDILNELLDTLLVNNNVDINNILENDLVCRKCGSVKFVKNGSSKGIKRYKCKSCGSTQSIDANTPLYNLKLKNKWVDFVYLMLSEQNPLSCNAIAEKIYINYKTAHSWRHKFLTALNKVNPIKLDEEVELDEIFINFCVKGRIGKEKYENYNYKNKSSNIPTKLRLDEIVKMKENQNSIFMCIHNRQGDFDFVPLKIQKKGSVPSKLIEQSLKDYNFSGKTIITDEGKPLTKYLKGIKNINHQTFKSSDTKNGKMINKNIHNNNINNVMSLFGEWSKAFKGYSTKYQWNYLKWFRFNRLFSGFNIEIMADFSLKDKESHKRYSNIFGYYEDYMIA